MYKPLVSVIVPIYNTGKYLNRCLDSILSQSFSNIEIIAVNNGSTDDSLDILNEYKNKYPEKMRVYTIPHAMRAGTGRNYGITKALGKYIFFSDSDDMMDLRAIENLYNTAEKGDYDVVFSPYYRVCDNSTKVMRVIDQQDGKITNEQMILECEPSPWAKLFKKEFLLKIGNMPEDFSFEDLAYFFVYSSYAKSIGYCRIPTYYYFVRSDSEVNTLGAKRIAETVNAELWGLNNCNIKNRDAVVYHIAVRLRGNLISRWPHVNVFIEQAKRLWPYFCLNERVINDSRLYNELKKYVDLPEERIPNNIYIAGFINKPTKDFLATLESAFFESSNIIVLDESTCNVNKNEMLKEAYREKKLDFVEQYFIFENLFNNGGIFLTQNMIIDVPLDFVKHLRAFFSYKSYGVFSSNIFGGIKHHKVFAKILSSFSIKNKDMSIEERIQNTLFYEFSLPREPQSRIYSEISTFLPDVFLTPSLKKNYTGLHMSHIDYDNDIYISSQNKTEIVSMEIDMLRCLVDKGIEQKTASIKKELKMLQEQCEKLKRQVINVPTVDSNMDFIMVESDENIILLKQQLSELKASYEQAIFRINEIEKSKSWIISQKFIKFSNSFWGRPLKWIVKLFFK